MVARGAKLFFQLGVKIRCAHIDSAERQPRGNGGIVVLVDLIGGCSDLSDVIGGYSNWPAVLLRYAEVGRR
jgi:hypothetical protein